MKMIDHNHFICHLILGTFTEYPEEAFGKYVLWSFCLFFFCTYPLFLYSSGLIPT